MTQMTDNNRVAFLVTTARQSIFLSERVRQSIFFYLWRGEVTGSTPGYVVLTIANEREIS